MDLILSVPPCYTVTIVAHEDGTVEVTLEPP